METLVIDNFNGDMTAYSNGDINSGRGSVVENFGANPFIKPGSLTWHNQPIQIDPAAAVITDMIMAGKERVESGVLYVYAIGHTGRLYKIQVNDPVTYNANYDNPVLVTTLTINTPTFTRGGTMDFFGATEKIYIGGDKGVTSINFDGTGEAFVGVLGSWTQTVPRPLKQFIGKLYAGNGSNIAEIDSTATVTSYAKLTPGFPTNTQVRDIDVSPDGNYLEIVVSRLALYDITAAAQDTTSTANSESYIFKWNGTDLGYTAFDTFPSFSLTANTMFQDFQYTFGYDQFGASIFNPIRKILNEPEVQAPQPNAVASTGNILSWMAPINFDGISYMLNNVYGTLDREVAGYWTNFFVPAAGSETDIIRVPCQIQVSNFGLGSSSNGYTDSVYGTAKTYYSTLETSAAPTTKYRFYKWSLVPLTLMNDPGTPIEGIYQTQSHLFSKKAKIVEVRVYGEPWVANNSFTIDLIGSSGDPITGASKTFTAGSNLTVGADFAWYTPYAATTYTLALRVTNAGTANHVINRVEIDYETSGK